MQNEFFTMVKLLEKNESCCYCFTMKSVNVFIAFFRIFLGLGIKTPWFGLGYHYGFKLKTPLLGLGDLHHHSNDTK